MHYELAVGTGATCLPLRASRRPELSEIERDLLTYGSLSRVGHGVGTRILTCANQKYGNESTSPSEPREIEATHQELLDHCHGSGGRWRSCTLGMAKGPSTVSMARAATSLQGRESTAGDLRRVHARREGTGHWLTHDQTVGDLDDIIPDATADGSAM